MFSDILVGERCIREEVASTRSGGFNRRENVGMSNEKYARIILTESPRVPGEG